MPTGVYRRTDKHKQIISAAIKKVMKNAEAIERLKIIMKEVHKRKSWITKQSKPRSAKAKINMKIAQNRREVREKFKQTLMKLEVKEKYRKAAHERMERGRYHVTDIERIMQNILIREGYNFKRNKHIENVGNVDFLLTDYNIIVECDGEPWHNKPDKIAEDLRRDLESAKLGYKTLRFKGNAEIKKDIECCLNKIREAVDKHEICTDRKQDFS